MKYIIIILSFILLTISTIVKADDSDDTLKYYLSKSDLVVIGMITTEPDCIIKESGVPNYICEFKAQDVLKGDIKLKDKIIKVNIMRFEMDKKDKHPLIKKDSESILFLKNGSPNNVPQWRTADFWFGIQHPSPWMAKSLKELAKKEK